MYPCTWHLETGRRYTQLAARMSLIAPLHFVDRETRWHRRRTSIWRTRAKVARSALTRVRKCTSRTSTREFETCPSVAAMQRRRSDDQNGRFDMEKIRETLLNKSQSSCPNNMAKQMKKERKNANSSVVTSTRCAKQTRYSAGGPKQKSACASRTETRYPHFLYTSLTGVKIGGSRIRP
jgi:hypothetical protein